MFDKKCELCTLIINWRGLCAADVFPDGFFFFFFFYPRRAGVVYSARYVSQFHAEKITDHLLRIRKLCGALTSPS